MTKQLTLNTRTTPAGPVVELSGELDHHTAPEVRAALPALRLQAGQQLVCDLGALTFCDSTGITVLIAARNHALAAKASIVFVAVPDRVSRIFHIVGLDQVFSTCPTAQDAEAAWRPPAG
ncbi:MULTISPECIES: STAS domain-containing protein [unclassified Streptomyces]|uniref:STAS domain-containing protein n=1 Tax=unclassified Streptomyces TaxID=2593676 RepID=UPI002E27E7DD|nr:STAS domain-containing protein [Streptomyces sp. NBC_01423]WSX94408.1 STAS domain-containing protein [Streptomyces sp. NBC_00891]WSY08885.1 STAS domain-containing protein [Streptomyces sp. NBC_00890]WSZ10508.1 STAS domain-containing protein [Streptomyces sp. NBC_00869]WSZ21989.1 STAS domain-containing protein [Streptomyces sp. NBC_00870]